jgi:hypothetical protein
MQEHQAHRRCSVPHLSWTSFPIALPVRLPSGCAVWTTPLTATGPDVTLQRYAALREYAGCRLEPCSFVPSCWTALGLLLFRISACSRRQDWTETARQPLPIPQLCICTVVCAPLLQVTWLSLALLPICTPHATLAGSSKALELASVHYHSVHLQSKRRSFRS